MRKWWRECSQPKKRQKQEDGGLLPPAQGTRAGSTPGQSQLLQWGGNGRQWHQRGESFLLAMFRVAQCVPSPKPQFHHLSDDEDTQWEVLLA